MDTLNNARYTQWLRAWLRDVQQNIISEARATAGLYLLQSLVVLWMQIKFSLLPAPGCPSALLISWVAVVFLCPRRSFLEGRAVTINGLTHSPKWLQAHSRTKQVSGGWRDARFFANLFGLWGRGSLKGEV